MYKKVIVVFVLLIVSCKSNNSSSDIVSKDYGNRKDTIFMKETDENNKTAFAEIDQKSKTSSNQHIKIIGTIKKTIDSSNTNSKKIEELGCNSWVVSNQDIENIFPKMEEINGNEWNSYCYHYPCSYKGIANYNGAQYNLYVNSASYIILYNDAGKKYFILKNDNNLFLKSCSCCED